jgi:MSHA biogenesis protein MshJ
MMNNLKLWWGKQAVRIDALSLRERAFLFISVIACCMALADVAWLSPAQLAHKQVKQRFDAQGAELDRLRVELKTTSQPVDASKVVRDDLQKEADQLDAVNQDIKTRVPITDGGPALEQVLVQFLRRHEGLTLLSVGTLAKEPASTPGANTGSVPVGLTKRGLELKVSGPYPELVRYVKTLESALPSLRWGMMQLKSEKQPPELTLQVYVVGAQP